MWEILDFEYTDAIGSSNRTFKNIFHHLFTIIFHILFIITATYGWSICLI